MSVFFASFFRDFYEGLRGMDDSTPPSTLEKLADTYLELREYTLLKIGDVSKLLDMVETDPERDARYPDASFYRFLLARSAASLNYERYHSMPMQAYPLLERLHESGLDLGGRYFDFLEDMLRAKPFDGRIHAILGDLSRSGAAASSRAKQVLQDVGLNHCATYNLPEQMTIMFMARVGEEVLAADVLNKRIARFNRNGEHLGDVAMDFRFPVCVCVGASGHIWAADYEQRVLYKMDESYNEVDRFDLRFILPERLAALRPFAICAAHGSLYCSLVTALDSTKHNAVVELKEEGGAAVHVVDESLDAVPVVAYCAADRVCLANARGDAILEVDREGVKRFFLRNVMQGMVRSIVTATAGVCYISDKFLTMQKSDGDISFAFDLTRSEDDRSMKPLSLCTFKDEKEYLFVFDVYQNSLIKYELRAVKAG